MLVRPGRSLTFAAPACQMTWMTSPVYTVFAQQFLPAELWVPFFNFMQFLTGVSVRACCRPAASCSHLPWPNKDLFQHEAQDDADAGGEGEGEGARGQEGLNKHGERPAFSKTINSCFVSHWSHVSGVRVALRYSSAYIYTYAAVYCLRPSWIARCPLWLHKVGHPPVGFAYTAGL